MSGRLLIVSPVRNEAAHIERVVRAMAAQTRPPDAWIVVDDGSTDGTGTILERLASEVSFLRVFATPAGFTRESADRLAVAAAPRAFNFGLSQVDRASFAWLGKLDGDVELPPDYFERLLPEFDRDATLGLAGGWLAERDGGDWRPTAGTREHVRGALKLYRRECFEAIGGVEEILGWDGVDEVRARMLGYRVRTFPELLAHHHRPTGTADGRLRGHLRWGTAFYITGHGPVWILARAVKVTAAKPYGLSGLAFVSGYVRAAVIRTERAGDAEYRRFLRRELRRRVRRRVARLAGRPQTS